MSGWHYSKDRQRPGLAYGVTFCCTMIAVSMLFVGCRRVPEPGPLATGEKSKPVDLKSAQNPTHPDPAPVLSDVQIRPKDKGTNPEPKHPDELNIPDKGLTRLASPKKQPNTLVDEKLVLVPSTELQTQHWIDFKKRQYRIVALSPDGKTIAATSFRDLGNLTVDLWDVASGKLQYSHSAPGVARLWFSSDSQVIWGQGQRWHSWDTGNGKDRWTAFELGYGKNLASTPQNGKPIRELVAISPDGKIVATRTTVKRGTDRYTGTVEESSVDLWNTTDWKHIANLAGNSPLVKSEFRMVNAGSVVFSLLSNVVAVTRNQWSSKTGQERTFCEALFFDTRDGKLLSHHIADRKRSAITPSRLDTADQLLVWLSNDGTKAAFGLQDSGELTVWDVAAGKRVDIGVMEEPTPRLATFSDDSRILATVSQSAIKIWNLVQKANPITATAEANVLYAAFMPGGKKLITFDYGYNVSNWRLSPEQAEKTNLTDASVFLLRGKAHGASGRYAECIADLTEFIRLSPKPVADAHESRGLAHFRLGQFNNAALDCLMTIQIDKAAFAKKLETT